METKYITTLVVQIHHCKKNIKPELTDRKTPVSKKASYQRQTWAH
jgi:hypothetical protein